MQTFNSDDDDVQVQEEYDRIKNEEQQGYDDSDNGNYFGGDLNAETETESTGESDNGLPIGNQRND